MIFCSKFKNYEDFAKSKRKDLHIFNLKNKVCFCGSPLRYFCEICKENVSHTTFQKKHRHGDLKRSSDTKIDDVEYNLLFDTIFEKPPKKQPKTNRTQIQIDSIKKLKNGMVDNWMIANNIDKIRDLNCRFHNTDLTLCDFLKELKFYSWKSEYYSNYDLVWQEIIATCLELWNGYHFHETFIDDEIDNGDLNNYVTLIESAFKVLKNQDLQNTCMELLKLIIDDFENRKIVQDLKVRLLIK